MTRAQATKVRKIAARIAKLAEQGLDAMGDDPMEGEVWSAFNRINQDANDVPNEFLRETANVV